MLIVGKTEIVIIMLTKGGLSQQTAGAWHQLHTQGPA